LIGLLHLWQRPGKRCAASINGVIKLLNEVHGILVHLDVIFVLIPAPTSGGDRTIEFYESIDVESGWLQSEPINRIIPLRLRKKQVCRNLLTT
jgi:hypothetical protein